MYCVSFLRGMKINFIHCLGGFRPGLPDPLQLGSDSGGEGSYLGLESKEGGEGLGIRYLILRLTQTTSFSRLHFLRFQK